MKKPYFKKILLWIIAAILLLVFYCWYTRPMTLSELYPMLELEKCTQVYGYYEIEMQPEQTAFTIEKGSNGFETICDLFSEPGYRRSLRNLLSNGTKTHRIEPGDFQWDVCFDFKDVEFPDGSTGSGTILHFTNWYGEFKIHCNGEVHSYRLCNQDSWLSQVLDVIQSKQAIEDSGS